MAPEAGNWNARVGNCMQEHMLALGFPIPSSFFRCTIILLAGLLRCQWLRLVFLVVFPKSALSTSDIFR